MKQFLLTLIALTTFACGQGSNTSVDLSTGKVTGVLPISKGGTNATTAAAARANLGTTVGANLFGLTNPSAVSFLRLNADNTVDALSASLFRTAIGAGTGSGTVTAVSVASANGISGTSSGGATPALTIALGAITPATVFASGATDGHAIDGRASTSGVGVFGLSDTWAGGSFQSNTGPAINGFSSDGIGIRIEATTGNRAQLIGTGSDVIVDNNGNITGATYAGNTIAAGSGTIATTSLAYITPGTGIAAALAINTGSAGAPVLFNGAGGTPSSLTGTNISGTAASLTAGLVSSIGNMTGDVTSVNRATTLANIPAIAGTNLTGTAANLTAGNATKWTTGRTIALTGGVTYTSGSLDGSGNVTGAATVVTNANLTGDVTSSGNATTLAAGSASNLNSGNLADARNTVSNSTTTTMSALGTIGGATAINGAGLTLTGNTTSGGTLTLVSTSHGTKGKILFGNSAYDEANNRLGIGGTSPQFTIDVIDQTSSANRGLINTNYNSGSAGALYGFLHARGIVGSPAAIANGDEVGAFVFKGYSNSAFQQSAYFLAVVNGAVSGTSVPMDLVFATGAIGASERLRITSGGNITITGTQTTSGASTFTGAITNSSLTASKPVFTDASKALISGTGVYPVIVASTHVLAQTATNASIATYTTPNDGAIHSFNAGGYVNITAISAGTLTVQISFTDENNAAQTLTYFAMGVTSSGLTTTGFTGFSPMSIRCKDNTAITFKTSFTGVSITYDAGGVLESMY